MACLILNGIKTDVHEADTAILHICTHSNKTRQTLKMEANILAQPIVQLTPRTHFIPCKKIILNVRFQWLLFLSHVLFPRWHIHWHIYFLFIVRNGSILTHIYIHIYLPTHAETMRNIILASS